MTESERGSATPVSVTEVPSWSAEADVVVVGLGAAGACAAIEAARAGASVLVLERAGGGGGTTAVSDGMMYFGGGTALQRACGFEDSVEEMVKYLMASCGPEPDEARIRRYCEESAAHYDWLVELGIPFKAEFYPERMLSPGEEGLTYSGNELVHPFRDQAVPAPRAHMPQKEGQAGAMLMQKLIAAAEQAGAEIVANVLCERLVLDDGRVVGVEATLAGETHHYRARRGVVLCAGGFVNNREMIRQYAPTLRKARFKAATEGDDGRGIRMGMGAGGAAIRMSMGSVTLPFYPPKKLMRGIFVNQHGQRFMPEDVYQGRAGEIALLQQDGRVWLVLDDESFERPVFAGGEIHAAETIEELESELGFAPGSLQSTVALYNAGAERGEDPVFHKAPEYVAPLSTPPFGAIDLSWDKAIYAAFTLGGLATDTEARVLNPDGAPVPGLYAAGRTAASISSPGYSSGTSIGEAQIYGRIGGAQRGQGGLPMTVDYNPFMDEVLYGDPYPVYARMRAEDPVYYVEEYDAWFLSRFEDIWRAGPDFQHFTATEGTTPPHLLTKDTPLNLSFASMDPPQHSKYRAQVAPLFKPGAVKRVEAEIAPIVKTLVDEIVERGECDFVQDLASQVSVRGALSTIGLPLELADRALGWVNGIFAREDGHRGATEASNEGGKDMFFTILDRVKELRKSPEKATGILELVMNSDVDGDKMDDFRLASLACVILIGGTDTLPKALAATLHRLWQHPDQRRELANDLGLAKEAFLEGLRLDTPTQHPGRTVTKEIEFRGKVMKPGQRCMFMWASANRDENEFDRPDEYIMKRRPPRMLAFGHGVHMCLGKHVAAMEARLSLTEVMRRLPEYEIDEAKAVRNRTEFVRGWTSLPAKLA